MSNITGKVYDHSKESFIEACGYTLEELKKISKVVMDNFRQDVNGSKMVENIETSSLSRKDLCILLIQTVRTGLELAAGNEIAKRLGKKLEEVKETA